MLFVVIEKYFGGIQEVVSVFGCSENSWYRWKKEDELPLKCLKRLCDKLDFQFTDNEDELSCLLIQKYFNNKSFV